MNIAILYLSMSFIYILLVCLDGEDVKPKWKQWLADQLGIKPKIDPEEHDIVKYTAISWYREEFVGGVDLGRNYMHAKYKFFELVVNKKYILEIKHKKNGNAR